MYSEVRSTTSASVRWLVWHRRCAYLSAYLSSAVLLVVLADNPSLPPGRLGKEDRHLKIYELWDNLGHSVTVTQEDEKITTTPARFRVSVAAGYVSTLQLISAEEHESGMRKFEKVYGHVDTLEYILALDRISWTNRAAVTAGYDTQHET
ncbi:MAG: hypothetical protein IIC71_03835 [Acidobacteria bacterium]|nr:hypothetical protein [Acidobacteriota bacterium]